MDDDLTTIRNVGPATAEECRRAGISSAEMLRALGADEAYARLIATGSRPHFIGYYALVLGLQGRPWNDCSVDEKARLRVRFDGIVAAAHDKGRSDLEAALDEIGVGVRRQPTSSSPEKK